MNPQLLCEISGAEGQMDNGSCLPNYERLPHNHFQPVATLTRGLGLTHSMLEFRYAPQAKQKLWSVAEMLERIIRLEQRLRTHLAAYRKSVFCHQTRSSVAKAPLQHTNCAFCDKLVITRQARNGADGLPTRPLCGDCRHLLRKFELSPRTFPETFLGGCTCQHDCNARGAAAQSRPCNFCRLVKMLSKSWMKRATGK